jgi:hypothetical protein
MAAFLYSLVQNFNFRFNTTALVAASVATAVGLAVIFSRGFTPVRITNMKKSDILLAGVHQNFVQSVEGE